MTVAEPKPTDVFRLPGFLTFWAAGTVSGFGGYITTLALQVLVVLTLHGSATDVGLVNASRWLPYLLLGLVVGALVDRGRRRPVLIATDLGRALLLMAIPGLWLLGGLTIPALMAFVALFGLLTLLNDAATQSFLPRLIPAPALLAANARLDQGAAVAQTAGPVLAGGLVTALGAPLAVLADAATYLISAVAIWRIRVAEPAPGGGGQPLNLRREIGEGLRWVYGHRTLSPLALSTHGFFLFNNIVATVFTPFVLVGLGLSPLELGVALAAGGLAALGGSLVAAPLGRRWGAGRAIIACRIVTPLAWGVVALAPASAGHAAAIAVVAAGQALYGFGLGAENANEMTYRQAVTPDALQGRMNTTMRSINRAMIVVGAPLGGLLADRLGYRPAMWIGVAGLALVPALLAMTPVRRARHEAPAA